MAMKPSKTVDFDRRNEDRLWRKERRAGEERRASLEKRWREQPSATRGVRVTNVRKAEWMAAMRWRRAIQSVCRREGLTFTQWLLLDSIQQLIAETGDAVIQAQIAARTELDQGTICEVTQRLEQKRLVNRGEDMTGKAWRVILTEEAELLLRELDLGIERASAVGP